MQKVWIRDETSRLVRTLDFSDFTLKDLTLRKMEGAQTVSLRDRCYPSRSAQPSCISLPPVTGNNFELKPHFINMLPRFTGIEDAYLFIQEFEEVCALMKIQQLSDDSIRLRFITFALKDNAKKWLYSLPNNSISTWEGFVVTFLKKYFPNHKTAKIRTAIHQFCQHEKESF